MADGSTTTRATRAPGIPTRRRRPHPDAAMIALCARFDDLERHVQATRGDCEAGSPEEEAAVVKRDAISDQQDLLFDEIVSAHVITRAGHRARAASLRLWKAGKLERKGDATGCTDDRLIWAVVRDLVRSPA